jgi:hypothetical protein
VSASKYVGSRPFLSATSSTRIARSEKTLLGTSSQPIWMRSVAERTCGLVYVPTLWPASSRMHDAYFVTDPLPFVPDTCRTLRSACGSPSAVRRAWIVSSL